MAGPLKNEDFLCVSAYIRALESQLLTEADMTRMVDAAEHSEALRVLAEHEYPLMEENMASVEKGLQLAQKKLFEDLSGFQMDSRVFDFFRVRQDYHNVKVLLKSAVTGADPDPLLMSGDGGAFKPHLQGKDEEPVEEDVEGGCGDVHAGG